MIKLNVLEVIRKVVKQVVIVLIVQFNQTLAQDNSHLMDTLFYSNGRIQVIYEHNPQTHTYNGIYREYDSTGVLLIEGRYESVDSTNCKDCYDVALINFGVKAEQVKYDWVQPGQIKVGIWKYYYPNGNVKMQGKYSRAVHAYQGYNEPENTIDSGPINVWIAYEDLKDGEWVYYNEKGIKVRAELFVNGSLVLTKDHFVIK